MPRRSDTRKCPYCAEEIKREAKLCRYCGKEVPVEEPALHHRRSVRHLRGFEYDSLTDEQQVVVLEYGYLVSPEDALSVKDMLSKWQTSPARSFVAEVGEKVTYSE